MRPCGPDAPLRDMVMADLDAGGLAPEEAEYLLAVAAAEEAAAEEAAAEEAVAPAAGAAGEAEPPPAPALAGARDGGEGGGDAGSGSGAALGMVALAARCAAPDVGGCGQVGRTGGAHARSWEDELGAFFAAFKEAEVAAGGEAASSGAAAPRRRRVRWWTQPAAAGGGRTRWSRRASCAARSCWRSGRRLGGRRAQLAWRSGTPADGEIRLSGRPPRRRRRPNGPSTRGGAAAAPGARASGARCAGRPPTRGAPEAAGSGYGRGGRKTKTGGRRWRGLGWRAIAGLWSRCASSTGRAGSTASTC